MYFTLCNACMLLKILFVQCIDNMSCFTGKKDTSQFVNASKYVTGGKISQVVLLFWGLSPSSTDLESLLTKRLIKTETEIVVVVVSIM